MLSAGAAVEALRRGDITAERYAGALLRRCEAGARLNAFITLRPEQVLEAARERDRERSSGRSPGLLHGLPIPIKDSVNTCDLPTTAGTAALRHFQPQQDAPVVRALRGKPDCRRFNAGRFRQTADEFHGTAERVSIRHRSRGRFRQSRAVVFTHADSLTIGPICAVSKFSKSGR